MSSLQVASGHRSNLRRIANTTLFAALATAPLHRASAQAFVERNTPVAPRPVAPAKPVVFEDKAASLNYEDDTPLGVRLQGICILGRNTAPGAEPLPGVTKRGDSLVDRKALDAALEPLIGKPLTLKLVAQAQSRVAAVYRDAGYPFVAVSLPAHDATSGVLQLQVTEYHLAQVAVMGERPELANQVRSPRGEPINAAQIEEDLDWLNRNPYRSVQGVFAPGDALGESNLTLSVNETKPWQVYTGYANTGTPSTGNDRYFVGAAGVLTGLNHTLVSYQFTGSSDAWGDSAYFFPSGVDRARYISHSGRIATPIAPRQSLEISGNRVSTRQEQDLAPGVILQTDNDTTEIPVYYRSAISNLIPGLYAGDLILGLEFKRAGREVRFAGAPLGSGSADVFQLVLGWSMTHTDSLGTTAMDMRIKSNPGGVLADNDDNAWRAFTGGRMHDARYTYGTLDLNRTTPLPGRLAWVAQINGILASSAIPDMEMMAPGGVYGARGYTPDDGTVDRGLTLRNELRLPPHAFFKGSDEFTPFVFFDCGWGDTDRNSVNLASAGAGADYRWSSTVSARTSLGVAARDAAVTKAGDARFNVQLTLSY